MTAVANVAINVDAKGARAALQGLSGVVDGLGNKIKGLGDRLTGLGGIAASLGAGAALSGFVRAGVEADRTAKTIKALAQQYGEAERVTNFANDAANKFGLGQTTAAKAVADLYGRLRPMGISLEQIQSTFIGVNNAAALMNLSAADTDGVMLQLSQAMGSGALQGDELRSVMERLPAIGQAIAKVMAVDVSQIKQLGSEGKITTDIIVKALNGLAGVKAPPPDAYKLFQKTLEDLNTTIGTKLLPGFTPLVVKVSELTNQFLKLNGAGTIVEALMPLLNFLTQLLSAFSKLPPGVQQFIIQVTALAGVFALVAVPLGIFLKTFGGIILAVKGVITAISGLSILSTMAGWLGAVMPILTTLGGGLLTLGKILIGLFTGPVGWVTLLVLAGVAIYAFRDKIGTAFNAIGQFVANGAKQFYDAFIVPVAKWVSQAYEGIVNTFKRMADALRSPFVAVANMIKGVLNQVLSAIANSMNAVVRALNNMIAGANAALRRMRLPEIPYLPYIQVPQFAQGGYVDRPTLALIGEGGEREFVVPKSKATDFAKQWLNSRSAGGAAANQSNPVINIQTGPVLEQQGQRYVTVEDLEKSLQTMAVSLLNNNRSPGGRRFAGVG